VSLEKLALTYVLIRELVLSGVGGICGRGAPGRNYVKIENRVYQKEGTRIRFSRRKAGR